MSETDLSQQVVDEFEAGEPFSGEIEVPEIVLTIRDRLNEVREAVQKLNQELWGPSNDYREPEPVRRIRIEASLEPLYKEEARLQSELRELEWLIPPLMDPPHNGTLTSAKAKEILRHGKVGGEPLTGKQQKFFGAIAGGQKPYKK
jgi:hypothetical protein